MNNRIKEQTKSLWSKSFEDSKEFVDFYFDKVYSDKINHVVEHNGSVVAALQTIDFDIRIDGKTYKTAYLSGICTDKIHRNKGMMSGLIEKTHKALIEDNYSASFLIPAEPYLFEIYKKFQYRNFFYRSEYIFDSGNVESKETKVEEIQQTTQIDSAFDYYSSRELLQKNAIVCSKSFFGNLFEFCRIDSKKIFVAKNGSAIVGIAFVKHNGDILKHFANSKSVEQTLLNFVAETYKQERLRVLTNEQGQPYGMIRVFDKSLKIDRKQMFGVPPMMDK